VLQLSYQLRDIRDTDFALCVLEAFLVLCLARCEPLMWGVREGIRAQVAIGKACEDSRNGVEVPGGNWSGPEWSPGYSRGSIFSDFFYFRISSGDGESCPGRFFLQLYCLAWFAVWALKTEFFSNLGSLSNSGCEDFAERKKVNLRYFFRQQTVFSRSASPISILILLTLPFFYQKSVKYLKFQVS